MEDKRTSQDRRQIETNKLTITLILKGDKLMLQTIAIILVILWLLGMVTANTLGGFIHLLLVIAIISVLLKVISGRKIL